MRSNLSIRSCNKSSESMRKTFIEKKEYFSLLRNLDVTLNPHKARNPFRKRKTLYSNEKTLEQLNSEENAFNLLVKALFYDEPNKYLLPDIVPDTPMDAIRAEISVRNLKRIAPIFISSLKEEQNISPLETFWNKEVSTAQIVRWDVFEESLISSFAQRINTTIGNFRKINWNSLLQELFRKLSSTSTEIELFPGHPALSPIVYPGPTVSFKSFQSYIASGKFASLVEKSMNFNTYYLSERFKASVYTYVCGAEFKGSWKSYRRSGVGKLKLCDGSVYDGYFFHGARQGHGKLIGEGCMHSGYWERDCMDGPGEISYCDLSRITGVWKQGSLKSGKLVWTGGEYIGFMDKLGFNGKGTLVTKTGDVKKGIWNRSKLEGPAEITYKSGGKYAGEFVQDILDGEGCIDNDRYVYQGCVKNFLPNGLGKIVYKSGGEYEGEFIDGEPNGQGTYKINEATFKGQFVQGRLSGLGKKTVEKLHEYKGGFCDSLMHGKGLLKFFGDVTGRYRGEFKMNKFHGQGTLVTEDLCVEGEWVNGHLHGFYKITDDYCKFSGEILKDKVRGKGRIEFKDTSYYEGWWESSLPSGKGEAKDETEYFISAYFFNGAPVMKHRLSMQFFMNFQNWTQRFSNILEVVEWLNASILQVQ